MPSPTSSPPRLPPGPPAPWPLGTLPEFRRDPLAFMVGAARTYGGVVHLGLRRRVFLVSDPAGVKHVLQDNADNYGRNTRSVRALRETLGSGLLTITGPAWWRNRRLTQPAFHKQRLAGFASTMAAGGAELVARLRRAEAPADLVPEMSRAALQILGRCLFERDLADEADVVGRALNVVLHQTIDRLSRLFALPRWVPTPENLRFRAARRALDSVVLSLIAERRRAGSDRGDLLSMLLAARDEDSGEGLSDQQIRDEMMTLLLAGHETTALSLSWTVHLLARHPDVRDALEAEVDAVLGDRLATVDDLGRLTYTRAVLEESMRLYPPAWIITRSAEGDDQIGGYDIPAGSIVVVSPYVTHHDPTLWPDPETFDPRRFLPGSTTRDRLPRYAYFPFGGGPHLCIGAGFAMMEATILIAAIVQSLRVESAPGHSVSPEALVTLRPRTGLWMTVQARPRRAKIAAAASPAG
ncbi:MAG TPA: cytochrome P450 [Polyangia bacterium]|nr:cytochrome P450 [Polyangia bacterium]